MGSTMWRPLSRLRKIVAVVVVALVAAVFVSLGTTPVKAVQNFENAAIADAGLSEVGTSRPTGWNQPGECIKSVQRWVTMAGGHFGNGGVISGYVNSGAQEVSLASAVKGDVIQYTAKSNGDNNWSQVHTVVVVKNHRNGRFDIVQSNAPAGSGRVTRDTNWTPRPPSGWTVRVWRFGKVAPTGVPFGDFNSIKRAPGGALISGWAIDPNAASGGKGAIRVDTYGGTGSPGGGNPGKGIIADDPRPDVGRVYPKYGSNYGYKGIIPLGHRTHKVCAYAINVGPGSHKQIGCKSINVSPHPFGNHENVTTTEGGVNVKGWAIDPDTASAIEVHVYGGNGDPVGSNRAIALTANLSRPDVGDVYAPYGDLHGYASFFALPSGQHNVCAYALNAKNTVGSYRQIGCQTVKVP